MAEANPMASRQDDPLWNAANELLGDAWPPQPPALLTLEDITRATLATANDAYGAAIEMASRAAMSADHAEQMRVYHQNNVSLLMTALDEPTDPGAPVDQNG